MSKTFGGYTLEQIISFASIPPNEAQRAIAHIRALEADNARLTAERDARVVLPEMKPGDALWIGNHGTCHGAMFYPKGQSFNEGKDSTGLTPAAALEALRDKLKGQSDAH